MNLMDNVVIKISEAVALTDTQTDKHASGQNLFAAVTRVCDAARTQTAHASEDLWPVVVG